MSLTVPSQPRPLTDLLPGGAKGFAVVDLESTGTGQLCRIVEIALLLLTADGEIEQEWSTVINPGVPIPNAAVHGIDERLVAAAPSFAAVAPTLAALQEGRVLVAHNLDRFDGPILRHHFWEASEAWPQLVLDLGDGIDTMPNPFLSLGKLSPPMVHPQGPGQRRRVEVADVLAVLASLQRLLAEYPWEQEKR